MFGWLKSKRVESPLAAAFGKRQILVQADEEIVRVEGSTIAIVFEVMKESAVRAERLALVSFAVCGIDDPSTRLGFYRVGVGATRDEAVAEAMDQFVEGIWPALAQALDGKERSGFTATIQDQDSGRVTDYEVFAGGLQARGVSQEELERWIEATDLRDAVTRATVDSLGVPGLHTVDWSLCRTDDGGTTVEIWFDGQKWDEAAAALDGALSPPPGEGFLTMRSLFVFKPAA